MGEEFLNIRAKDPGIFSPSRIIVFI